MPSQQPALYSIIWACVSSWYYGYHLSELNFPVTSLTCISPAFPPPSRLPLCLGLDTNRYGLVTAIFTVGGLVGSSISSYIVAQEGVKGGIAWTGYLNLIGVIGMAIAPTWIVLLGGRFLAGVSSGIAICLVPPFLSLIARSSPQLQHRSGQIGTLHQLAIVIGLFCAQLAGWIFTGAQGDIPGNWRYVVMLPGVISAAQIYFANRVFTPGDATPKPAPIETMEEEAGVPTENEGRGSEDIETTATPLLHQANANQSTTESQVPIRGLLSNTALRGPALLAVTILVLQQFSGVNAVLFYSTPVLKPLLPGSAGLIGIGITLVNAVMTLPAIFLVDRVGRRSLLLVSAIWMGCMATLLAWALNSHHQSASAFAIVSFIAAFSIGLGPIPFLLVSEMVPSPAVPALSSLALSLSWIANFIIALAFLPLRDALSSPIDPRDPLSDRTGEGRIFYVFAGILAVLSVIVWRGLPGSNSSRGVMPSS